VASAPASPRGGLIQEDPGRVRYMLAGVCGAPGRGPAARAEGDRGAGRGDEGMLLRVSFGYGACLPRRTSRWTTKPPPREGAPYGSCE